MTEKEMELLRNAFGAFYNTLKTVEDMPDYYGNEYSKDLYAAVRHLGEILGIELDQKM